MSDSLRAERYSDTVRRLHSAQKRAASGAPAYSVYVNRRVGRYLAAFAYRAGLTPNQVTMISAVFTFTAIALVAFATPQWWLGVAVWLLLAIGYAFDSADGQVARLRGGGTASGEWLDHVVDCVKLCSLHLAVLITAYTHFTLPDAALLLIPTGFTIVAVTLFFAMILNDQLKAVHGPPAGTSGNGAASQSTPLKAILGIPTDYGVICFSFILLGAPLLFFTVYTVLFALNLGYLALASIKWFHDMAMLAPNNVTSRESK